MKGRAAHGTFHEFALKPAREVFGVFYSRGQRNELFDMALLQNRAKGMEAQEPRIPAGLFRPSRNFIRSALDRMYDKYLRISQGK